MSLLHRDDSLRPWTDVSPEEAAGMAREDLALIDRPFNEMGERCPWPWDPQQLGGAPLGQYHCPYCGGMVMAGVPHFDSRELEMAKGCKCKVPRIPSGPTLVSYA